MFGSCIICCAWLHQAPPGPIFQCQKSQHLKTLLKKQIPKRPGPAASWQDCSSSGAGQNPQNIWQRLKNPGLSKNENLKNNTRKPKWFGHVLSYTPKLSQTQHIIFNQENDDEPQSFWDTLPVFGHWMLVQHPCRPKQPLASVSIPPLSGQTHLVGWLNINFDQFVPSIWMVWFYWYLWNSLDTPIRQSPCNVCVWQLFPIKTLATTPVPAQTLQNPFPHWKR